MFEVFAVLLLSAGLASLFDRVDRESGIGMDV